METEHKNKNLTGAMLDLNDAAVRISVSKGGSADRPSPPTIFKTLRNTGFQQPRGSAFQFEDRRSKTRYAMELGVRFSKCGEKSRSFSIGKTVNISSSGLLVASEGMVDEGTELQLMIEWPWTLDGKVPLQLVATAVVVRSDQSSFAVALRTYQFRTMKPQAVRQASA